MTKLLGIVGGAGAEGSHFAEILKSSDLEIAISDIDTKKAEALSKERGYRVLSSEELASKSNLVIFSLPIDVTEREIQRLSPLVNEAMADLTSVKTKAVSAMVKYSKPEVEIFSVHPMYRPTISPWGQNIIMIAERPKEGGEWFCRLKEVFNKKKAEIDELDSPLDHDNEMASLQVSPHAIAYAFLAALEPLSKKVGLEQLQRHSTLLFRLMMEATGRIVSNPDSGRMYGAIQIENPATREVYDLLIDALKHQREIVGSGNLSAFEDIHRHLNEFLGEYAQVAAERTDRLMGRPLGLQIVYEDDLHDSIKEILGGFRKAPEKYKEYLETATILEGELTKLYKAEELVLARQSFYKSKESKTEGTYAFYIRNKKTDDGKRIRFSPVIPEDLQKALSRKPDCIRIQMYNRFHDHFMNLFDTWRRTPELHSLGRLVAYKTD